MVAGESVEAVVPSAPLSASDLREQILAKLDEPAEEAESKTAEVDEDAEEAESEEAETVEAASDDDDDSDEESTDEDDDDSDEEVAKDPKAQKGLDAVRRAEKRHREKMDADRAEFTAEKAKHAEALGKIAEFEQLARRAKYDPGAVLRALGLADDDFAAVAQAIYAESKEGAAEPARKAAATKLLREREQSDKLSATEKRLQEIEQRIEAKERQAAEAREVEQFVSEVTSAAKAKHPLAAHFLAKDPEAANDGIVAAYARLAKDGKTPKPADVVAEFDRTQRVRLKRLGIDPATLVKATPANGNKAKPVVPAKVNGTTKPKTRDEILAELGD
jgi:hypothetical protein